MFINILNSTFSRCLSKGYGNLWSHYFNSAVYMWLQKLPCPVPLSVVYLFRIYFQKLCVGEPFPNHEMKANADREMLTLIYTGDAQETPKNTHSIGTNVLLKNNHKPGIRYFNIVMHCPPMRKSEWWWE